VNTSPVEDWTGTYQPRQGVYLRRAPYDESFDGQLPAEARTELLEEVPPPQTYRLREIPTCRLEPPLRSEVFFRPPPPSSRSTFRPPPVSPVPPVATPPATKPAPRESHHNLWIWLLVLLGLSVVVNWLPKHLQPGAMTSTTTTTTTMTQPWVELRRALPAVPRALPVTSSVSSDPQIGQWHPVRFLDGTVVQVCYGGQLQSPAELLSPGRFIGDERVIGNHSWIWMTRPGATIPAWVDP
jgi:hypothetical protein